MFLSLLWGNREVKEFAAKITHLTGGRSKISPGDLVPVPLAHRLLKHLHARQSEAMTPRRELRFWILAPVGTGKDPGVSISGNSSQPLRWALVRKEGESPVTRLLFDTVYQNELALERMIIAAGRPWALRVRRVSGHRLQHNWAQTHPMALNADPVFWSSLRSSSETPGSCVVFKVQIETALTGLGQLCLYLGAWVGYSYD